MLRIKLQRIGRKKRPFYKLVVMPNLRKRDGKYIEEIGFYDPLQKILKYQEERLVHYIQNGAQPTNVIRRLILFNLE